MSADLVDGLRAGMPPWVGSAEALLLRVECFLQITGRTLSLDQRGTEEWRVTWTSFSALLHATGSDGTVAWDTAYNLFRRCYRALTSLGDTSLSGFTLPRFGQTTKEISTLIHECQKTFIPERVNFWRGWTARTKAGKDVVFRFFPIYERLGQEFTASFFRACEICASGGLSPVIPYVNEFATFIGEYEGEISPTHFLDEAWLFDFLERFCVATVGRAYNDKRQLYATTRNWSRFAFFLEKNVLGTVWAELHRPIPRPKAAPVEGDQTRIVQTEQGQEVRRALMTDVPLHLSDGEAKELLFKEIQSDLDAVKLWARQEVREAWARRNARLELAPTGIVSMPGPAGKNSGLDWRLTKNCPDWLAHAAATFQARGLVLGRTQPMARAFYPGPLDETAWALGLPTPNLLLAHAAILVAEHPKITASFLEKVEIYDANENLIGFVETDAGHYLVGVKSRKGANTAEQRVKLNDETAEVVRQIIALTEPLRNELKARNSQTWRRLFLATPSMGSSPKFWAGSNVASRSALWLCGRLSALAGLDPHRAFELAKRFTLRSLRASAAVAVYLETGSLEKFSEALGHEECRPDLLDCYLPKPIQQWFFDRWIRHFQTGMIVEAMRDSPYLLQASGFASMNELDSFLEHHALRNLPPHLENPDGIEDAERLAPPQQTRLAIGLDSAILTVLLSLNQAVKQATGEVCGRAKRWAMFCDRLTAHIEVQAEKPELRDILASAREMMDASKMESLVYG